jgi:hypothetical protein
MRRSVARGGWTDRAGQHAGQHAAWVDRFSARHRFLGSAAVTEAGLRARYRTDFSQTALLRVLSGVRLVSPF